MAAAVDLGGDRPGRDGLVEPGGALVTDCPDFTLRDIHGDEYRRDDYSGRWLLLVFHRHLG